ncbi:hypothetical protein HPB48_000138 [Haemaphysalis longicornis]|uniref:Uncharacterized protein n=1 Tax=Haemaphysalis longicornis TaxID=44386 RepID=A0A9J6GV37_HAELO|nr:hypothetical protein HPB48_000138 [Haemaphysalis longicornis]
MAASINRISSVRPERPLEHPRAIGGTHPSALALTAKTESPATPACPLCDSHGHKVADCLVSQSAAEKRARLRNARCCFQCDRRNRVARQCRASRNLTCSTCNGRHLTVLCDVLRPSDHTTPRPTPQVQAGQGAPPTVVTATSGHSGDTSVLLQMARAWAEGARRRLVRVLLDTESQRTFIRQDLSKALK